MTTTYSMAFETSDPKTWLADRLRRTNWAAAGIAGALQLGFLAMLLMMGIAQSGEPVREKPLVTVLASTERQPTPPAPSRPQQAEKQVIQPKADVVMPPPKLAISTAAPVVAAPERAPELPAPAPAPAAPSAPAAAPAAPSGPVNANLNSNLLSAPKPVFPMSSRHKHESGVVVLRVVVGEDGRVAEISVHRSSGFPALDNAALTAVRKWRWSPTIRDGRAVAITGTVGVNMVLNKT